MGEGDEMVKISSYDRCLLGEWAARAGGCSLLCIRGSPSRTRDDANNNSSSIGSILLCCREKFSEKFICRFVPMKVGRLDGRHAIRLVFCHAGL